MFPLYKIKEERGLLSFQRNLITKICKFNFNKYSQTSETV